MPDLEVDDPSGDGAGPRARLGLHLRPDRGRDPGRAQRRPRRRPRPPAPTSTRSRQPRRGAARLRPRRRPRDEPRPARDAAARRVPRRRPLAHLGARPAVLHGRARRRHLHAPSRSSRDRPPTSGCRSAASARSPTSPTTPAKQTKRDFTSDQEVRWCPGCGDYVILAAVQSFLPELGLKRENIVFVSGIGCSSRFPYYLDTYGMHSIHGRAPAIATGLATSRAATCRSGSSPVTATPCRSVATTSSTRCAATST